MMGEGLRRTDSIVNLDGSLPSMFPGIVMGRQQRRSSLVRPESSAGEGGGWGRKSEVGEAVVEEEEGSAKVSPGETL
jgi:hypothetical protein